VREERKINALDREEKGDAWIGLSQTTTLRHSIHLQTSRLCSDHTSLGLFVCLKIPGRQWASVIQLRKTRPTKRRRKDLQGRATLFWTSGTKRWMAQPHFVPEGKSVDHTLAWRRPCAPALLLVRDKEKRGRVRNVLNVYPTPSDS